MPPCQIILDAAKRSAASGGCREKQGQRSQSARGFASKHDAGTATRTSSINADAVPQLLVPRKAGIVRCH